jgi:GTP cyclohydrolase I
MNGKHSKEDVEDVEDVKPSASTKLTPENYAKLVKAAELILEAVGEDRTRKGLLKTPTRFATALEALTEGYRIDIDKLVNDAIFDEPNNNTLVIERSINIYTMCEHHMVPFFGKVHICYRPDGKVIGISKLARLAKTLAKKFQVQERLTKEIANAVEKYTGSPNVGVVVECAHMCMSMRGVEQVNADTVTSEWRGELRDDTMTRQEFLDAIKRRK